jgi:hypothetical protein
MPSGWLAAVIVLAALLVPAAAAAAAPAGPAVPETITLPSKIVQGDSASGTVCLDRVPDAPTEVLLFTDNSFAGTVEPTSVVITPPDQCATFTVHTSITGFTRELTLIVTAFANDTSAQQVLPIIPFAGYDLVEITRADVNRSFTKLTVVATSDEPGAVLTAFAGGVELGQLEQKGDRYVGRFDLNGQPINNVEVHSSLGRCAQRAVPFGTSSTHC